MTDIATTSRYRDARQRANAVSVAATFDGAGVPGTADIQGAENDENLHNLRIRRTAIGRENTILRKGFATTEQRRSGPGTGGFASLGRGKNTPYVGIKGFADLAGTKTEGQLMHAMRSTISRAQPVAGPTAGQGS